MNDTIYEDSLNRLSMLHLAAGLDSSHREAVIELLIDYKADPNMLGKSDDVEQVRPLHLAAMWGYDVTVQMLLYHGADASLRDANSMSAVDYASIFDNYQCISLLLKYGCLNSSVSAWSTIMDSTMNAQSHLDLSDQSSDGSCLYTTAIEAVSCQSKSPAQSLLLRSPTAESISSKTDVSGGDAQDVNNNIGQIRAQISEIKLDPKPTAASIEFEVKADTNNITSTPARPPRKPRIKVEPVEDPIVIDLLNDSDDITPKKELDDDYDPLDSIKDDEIDMYMDNQQLRLRLRCLGKTPGPITDTTKRLYLKLLARLVREDKELVYSPKTKSNSDLNGRSVELNSFLTGKFPVKQALELEKEFIRLSSDRHYHGPKLYFNYILIDPRISQNLPEQAFEAMSDSDTSGNKSTSPSNSYPPVDGSSRITKTSQQAKTAQTMGKLSSNRKFNSQLFDKFVKSIFYIGKGQKKRDLMHLYDALEDRNSITKKKIDRIRSIWADGCGVVSLHLFHNITSKEALTREALMIESVSLCNLTNLLKGTIQFKLGWNEHKRKLLGALLIYRAYVQFLNEGERQLRREDLRIDK